MNSLLEQTVAPRWIARAEPNPEVADLLARELNLPAALCRLLALRGFTQADSAKQYLKPRLEELHDPFLLAGMDAAVARLRRAVRDQPFEPNDPQDALGHGTHVAGTIGAMGHNGRGVTGINWQSALICLKFLDTSNSGQTADAVAAINYATMMRKQFGEPIRVLNASWGQSGSESPALRAAIEARGRRTCCWSPLPAMATSSAKASTSTATRLSQPVRT